MKTMVPFALCAALVSGGAHAQSSPSEVTRVTEGLIAAGMAIELGDFCDEVSVRLVRGLSFLQGLKGDLRDAGFTDAQIESYIDNDQEKDRLEAIARGRLADLGVVTTERASYCRVAKGQISQGTQVGQLLR